MMRKYLPLISIALLLAAVGAACHPTGDTGSGGTTGGTGATSMTTTGMTTTAGTGGGGVNDVPMAISYLRKSEHEVVVRVAKAGFYQQKQEAPDGGEARPDATCDTVQIACAKCGDREGNDNRSQRKADGEG